MLTRFGRQVKQQLALALEAGVPKGMDGFIRGVMENQKELNRTVETSYYVKPKDEEPISVLVFVEEREWSTRNRNPLGLRKDSATLMVRKSTVRERADALCQPRLLYEAHKTWRSLIFRELEREVMDEHVEALLSRCGYSIYCGPTFGMNTLVLEDTPETLKKYKVMHRHGMTGESTQYSLF